MDPERKQSRRGIATIIAVLVVVCAWWVWFLPRTELYKNYKEKSDLERTLRAISPPAGATLVGISTMPGAFPQRVLLISTYRVPSAFDMVESHYMQEFPRHGFAYQGGSGHTRMFCAPGYLAVLSPMVEDSRPLIYGIVLHRRDGPC